MKNEFVQFDQFEMLSSSNINNKYLFDFAHSALNENNTLSSSLWMIKNKVTRLTNMTSSSGDTGVRPIIFGNPTQNPTNVYGPIYVGTTASGGLSQGATLTSTYPLTIDNGQEQVPLMQEDTLVYLGTTTSLANLTPQTFYRSGYIELSIKTSKQNCIVGYGSSVIRTVNESLATPGSGTGTLLQKNITDPKNGNISSTQYASDEAFADINELSINVKNGKLCLSYNDLYGINQKSFEVIGNTNIADGNWHHIVINLTRPGTIDSHSTRKNNRSIELWVDGKLDKVDNNSINNDQVFFPEILWLGANPVTLFNSQLSDLFYSGFDSQDPNTLANNTRTENVWNGVWPAEAQTDAFSGAIRTFAHGLNIPLTKFEIQERYKFWNYDELPYRDAMMASATMPEAIVTVNKKKALKLFWNNIPNKNGIELDDNFIVDAYSVTHKNKNSSTETFNLDLAKKKDFTILPNVRIALTDNVLLWGPGNVSPQNLKTTATPTQYNPNKISDHSGFTGSFTNLTFSGVELNNGDRVLLTNQINKAENGIWVFNGKTSPLTRPSDADSAIKINSAIVYVTEGDFAKTYWTLEHAVASFREAQLWTKLESKPDTTIYSQPFLISRWEDEIGNPRFIDINNDLNVSDYDLIVFMNYPETLSEIKQQFPHDDITDMYKEFIASIKTAVIDGARLYVSSPMLALDLKIVSKFTSIPQLTETTDAQSAVINPFQPGEPAERYFDTHRNNQYQLATSVAGLTNKETYILTDFINYIPDNSYDYEQYHAKYAYRQTGLQEGNTWFIPGLALTKFTENDNLPGDRNNYRGTKDILGVNMNNNGIYGTVITKLANNYYNGSTVTANPYDDYATTIAVLPGQTLDGQSISGKIFMNVIEDGYTFSRADYNKAVVQVVPTPDTNETTNTRLWQYSTNRLNRVSDRNNIKLLTEHGQTVPTIGGGGGFIQAASNASSGIIRSKNDANNIDYQSDYYPKTQEEIYSLQEIPVLSMTYLGLQWLAE